MLFVLCPFWIIELASYFAIPRETVLLVVCLAMQMFHLVVDHCADPDIEENIANSTEDRSKCEAKGEMGGEHFLLNVNTPLQLGGRANPSVNYPSSLGGSYTGCIKNLRHNGLVCHVIVV